MLLQSRAGRAAAISTSSSSICRVQPFRSSRRLVVADASLKETAAVPVMDKGELSTFPEQPAVYAVFDKDGAVQYIGLTRKVCCVVARCSCGFGALKSPNVGLISSVPARCELQGTTCSQSQMHTGPLQIYQSTCVYMHTATPAPPAPLISANGLVS